MASEGAPVALDASEAEPHSMSLAEAPLWVGAFKWSGVENLGGRRLWEPNQARGGASFVRHQDGTSRVRAVVPPHVYVAVLGAADVAGEMVAESV